MPRLSVDIDLTYLPFHWTGRGVSRNKRRHCNGQSGELKSRFLDAEPESARKLLDTKPSLSAKCWAHR
jgi:hypothetical protein